MFMRERIYKSLGQFLKADVLFLSALLIFAGCLAVYAQPEAWSPQHYRMVDLGSLGGANSRGNSINNRGWIAGYSNLSSTVRHAALWQNNTTPRDLGTLGSPERNSAVTWSVKNNNGLIVGISQTNEPMPLGESWSCSAFIAGTTYTCLGFAWEDGAMRPLNPLSGGFNSFATDANNRREIVGWAENGVQEPTCVGNDPSLPLRQVLQFRPVVWQARSGEIRDLPTPADDSSGAATGINNRGQIVGIAGDCDQGVGRRTARHALLWDRGQIIDLGNLGAEYWNTPTDINERGDIVGFAGTPGDVEGNVVQAFIWTRHEGMRRLPPLINRGHVSTEAYGINERRQVVGISCDVDFVDCRAVIWENGVVKDLNDLKNQSYAPRLEQAKDINERGEITGRSFNPANNERRAFLAIPR